MRHTRILLSLISLLLMTPIAAGTAKAIEDDVGYDEYEETSRVARISLLRGTVSLKRAGNKKWERAAINLPLVEGDTLATERGSYLEIQIDARNFVRVGSDSVVRIVSLRHEGVALSLVEGTATVRLARLERDKEYFEMDAPRVTMAAEKLGVYRLDVSREGDVRVIVRDGGRARIYSETSGFSLRDGRSAKLIRQGAEAGDWELSSAPNFDEWDRWTDDRERYLAARLRFDGRERYYDRDVWGAEELDVYGDWTFAGSYGWVWRPHITVINNYNNWAPYRYGHWRWCPPYGWTWVGDEPWGWAPYHYGRWVHYNNNWCWAPRGYGYKYKRSWWRPALVAFVYVNTSHGEHVAWYPLGHGQRDPRGRYWQHHGRDDRLAPLRSHEIANLRRINPVYQRAVNTLSVREFGAEGARARAATPDLAQRAVTNEPVLGRLPIIPKEVDANPLPASLEDRGRVHVARPAAQEEGPSRALPERPTGASPREPGVTLDNELLRMRIYNGREPRQASIGGDGSDAREATGNTGAVERPSRAGRNPSIERRSVGGDEDERLTNRPARPERRNSRGDASPTPADSERRISPERQPAEVKDEYEDRTPVEGVSRPTRQGRSEEPSVSREGSEREERREQDRPLERRRERDDVEGRRPPVESYERPVSPRPQEERPQPARESERQETRERRPEPVERPEPRPQPRDEPSQPQHRPEPSRPAPPAPPRDEPQPQRERSGPARPAEREVNPHRHR